MADIPLTSGQPDRGAGAYQFTVHDTNPHALSPKVKSYVQAQHWFQDLTTVGV